MTFLRHVSRLLDDEHRAFLDLIGRVEQAFARAPRRGVPDAELARLLDTFAGAVESDVGRHFDFEEQQLFPRLADAGEGDITALLTEEHDAMREVAAELLPMAREAAAGAIEPERLEALRRGVFEMVERQVAHIQKETMALLPMLDQLLDDETDRELAFAHAQEA
jgi:hemerythrin-like domain-containing protein